VLLCHAEDRIDTEGLTSWLATSFKLVGVVMLRERPGRMIAKIRREIRRVGWLRFLDVVAYRAYYRLRLARSDAVWVDGEIARLRTRYPVTADRVTKFVTTAPSDAAVRRFLRRTRPDLLIARCKFILPPEVFNIPRFGTFVLHPGICPEYRNAHGCFWALSRRDLTRVGMTLLRVNEGIDTGPIFLHATYRFDEVNESPVVIQYRVVLENLDAIASALISVCGGGARPVAAAGRRSAVWGQPWMSAYRKWKSAARADAQ
jgi:folate-dependent phosphoribosylglycinamide formyltransferase PurN